MAAVPGLGRALSGEERNRLRAAIAKKKAEAVAAERRAQAAKDKASVRDVSVAPKKSPANRKQGAGEGRLRGKAPEYPTTKVRAGGRTARLRTKVPTTVVQGATDNEAQRRAAAAALARRRANRPSRAAEPQAEKPKNPNYKSPKKAPSNEVKGLTTKAPRKPGPMGKGHQYPDNWRDLTPEQRGKIIDDAKPKNLTDEARRKAGKKTGSTPDPDKGKVRAEDKEAKGKGGGKKTNSQPGPGANTGGTGRDQDGGKGRTQFEDDRREGMAGQAKDRPGVYHPPTDYRGGYGNRSKPIPPSPDKGRLPPRRGGVLRTDSKKGGPTPQELHDQVRDADEQTKQRIRDILDGKAKTRPIPPVPGKRKIPPYKPGGIYGMLPRV